MHHLNSGVLPKNQQLTWTESEKSWSRDSANVFVFGEVNTGDPQTKAIKLLFFSAVLLSTRIVTARMEEREENIRLFGISAGFAFSFFLLFVIFGENLNQRHMNHTTWSSFFLMFPQCYNVTVIYIHSRVSHCRVAPYRELDISRITLLWDICDSFALKCKTVGAKTWLADRNVVEC